MTKEELAELFLAHTTQLRDHLDRRLGEQSVEVRGRIDALVEHFDGRLGTLEERFDSKLDTLEERFDSKLGALEQSLDGKLAAQDARFIDQMMILEQHMREHFDLKLSTVQTHIYGKLLSIESDMLDLRGDVAKLRETVNAHARMLEERR
jgi:hypothetical protein